MSWLAGMPEPASVPEAKVSSEKLEIKVLLAAIDNVSGPFKSIRKGASELGKSLDQARNQLKGLHAQQGNIKSYTDAQRAAAITANAHKGLQDKIRALKEEMAKTPEPTQKMIRALKAAEGESGKLKDRHAALITKQQQLFQQMRAGGIDVSKLADHSRDLATRQLEAADAVKKLGAAYADQQRKVGQLVKAKKDYDKHMVTASRVRSVGTRVLGAGAAIGAATAVPVLAYAKAEDSATQLKISMMQQGGKVASEFKEINDLAMKLGNRLPGTTSDFQDMMTMLIRQGMPAKNILGGLGQATAYLAVQLKMVPTQAAEFASKLQDATRTTDKDMMALMDTIQKSFYLGVDQGNMLQGFAKLSSALSVLKKEGAAAAKEIAPLLVMADQAGMAGEASGNAYRKVFQMAMDAGKVAKGNSELAGTGVKLNFTDGKGEFGGLEKMFAQLEMLRGVNTQQRLGALKKIFGDDAETLQALTLMIEKGVGGYREVQAKMEAQADLQRRVNEQLGTLSNLWDAATGTFTNALVALGESVAPELHSMTEWLGQLAERTQAWAKENPGLASTLMTIGKWSAIVAISVGGLLATIGTVAVPLAVMKLSLSTLGLGGLSTLTMLQKMGTGIATLGRFLLASPLGIAITLLAFGAYLIYENWEPISAFFSELWNKITTGLSTASDFIRGKLAEWYIYWKPVFDFVGGLPDMFVNAGISIMEGLANGIKKGWRWVMDALGGLAKLMPGSIEGPMEINSPSRVFAQLGEYTMEGMEQGIYRGQHKPLAALSSTAKAIAAAGAGILIAGSPMAAASTPQGQSSFSVDSSAPMVFHIHAAPGMDERALARAVREELAKVDAENAARRRSSFRDRD